MRFIDQYLEWRQRLGEQLKPNSPLFRIVFDTIAGVNAPKPVSRWVIARMIHHLLDTTGVRAAAETRQPTELMQTHGFRKHFKTTCINAGMNPLYSEYPYFDLRNSRKPLNYLEVFDAARPRCLGNLSGSPISFEYSCSPGGASEDTVVSNST